MVILLKRLSIQLLAVLLVIFLWGVKTSVGNAYSQPVQVVEPQKFIENVGFAVKYKAHLKQWQKGSENKKTNEKAPFLYNYSKKEV